MAGLNIAEKRIPQDGRIRTRMAGREIDLRVSSLPVRHGERVVMRILEKGSVFSLDGISLIEVFGQNVERSQHEDDHHVYSLGVVQDEQCGETTLDDPST